MTEDDNKDYEHGNKKVPRVPGPFVGSPPISSGPQPARRLFNDCLDHALIEFGMQRSLELEKAAASFKANGADVTDTMQDVLLDEIRGRLERRLLRDDAQPIDHKEAGCLCDLCTTVYSNAICIMHTVQAVGPHQAWDNDFRETIRLVEQLVEVVAQGYN